LPFWSIFPQFDIFYGILVYFVVIWYIIPVLVYGSTKNLATLLLSTSFPTHSDRISWLEKSATLVKKIGNSSLKLNYVPVFVKPVLV
jgi:disulfide oxidoreductase YuzD